MTSLFYIFNALFSIWFLSQIWTTGTILALTLVLASGIFSAYMVFKKPFTHNCIQTKENFLTC